MLLDSTQILVSSLRKKYGDHNFVRYCRNLGIPFEDCYEMMFDKLPTCREMTFEERFFAGMRAKIPL